MRWLPSCSALLLSGLLAACDDAPPSADHGSGTDTDSGTAASDAEDVDETDDPDPTDASDGPSTGSDAEVVDDTDDPDPTEVTDDPSTGDPPPPCEHNSDCEDGNACTEDVCNSGVCAVGGAVVSVACRPTIDVEFPPRAATLQDDSPVVTVTGTVSSPAGPISSLRINAEDVAVAADGSFSHDVTAQVGGNTLVLEALDAFEAPRRRVQSFLYSPSYRLPTNLDLAPEGFAVYHDQQTLDDGQRVAPPDDLATLLTLALQTVDLESLIDPATAINSTAGYNNYLTTIQYTQADVTLAAIDGGIQLQGVLYGISGDLVFDCVIPACELAGGDGTGNMTLDSIQVTADLLLSVNASHELVVQSSNTQTDAVNLDLTSHQAWTNFLITPLEPFISGGVVADIEADLGSRVDSVFSPALLEAFNGLAPGSVLQLTNLADADQPIEVALDTDFASIDFHDGVAPPDGSPPQGGVITLRGGGSSVNPVRPYTNLGIPDRAGCGAGGALDMPREGELEIGLADDLLNQLLYGAWEGGLLELDLGPELLPPDGISDADIHVSGMLAPTVSDCSPDGQVRAHLGDVRIDGNLTLSTTPLTFTAYSSLLAGLELTPTASGVAIAIGEVESVDTELSVNEDAALELEPLLTSTLETALVDGVLGAISSGGLVTIDLPEIDLSATLGLPPGAATLNVTTSLTVRVPGVTVIRGDW